MAEIKEQAPDRIPSVFERPLTIYTLVATIVTAISGTTVAYITTWRGPLELKQLEAKQEEVRFAAANATTQAQAATRAVQQSSQQVAQLQGATAGTLEQGQKLCRVMQNKQWKDGLIVPKSWPISLCRDYMLKSGGSKYQLGCVYQDGLTLGTEDGTIPSPNCGWL